MIFYALFGLPDFTLLRRIVHQFIHCRSLRDFVIVEVFFSRRKKKNKSYLMFKGFSFIKRKETQKLAAPSLPLSHNVKTN